MPFSFSLVEYVLVPGTIVLIGGSVALSTLKSNKDFSNLNTNKLEISENLDLTENFKDSLRSANQDIKEKFESVIETSEKVTKAPITFSYQPISDDKSSIQSINYIDITISFVLEPNSENWKQQESTVLFRGDSAFTIKRWIPKNHNDSSVLPECRYSWSSTPNVQNLKTPGTESQYLEQLKKFLQESKTGCNPDQTKGMEFTTQSL